MKVFIDIGHPAHVHYFKNFIRLMEQKGHSVVVMARDKEVTFQLLNYYKIPYSSRGKGSKGFLGKLLYIFRADYILLRKARKTKPDLFLSFGSPYAAHTAWILRKPHIAFDDTDNNIFEHILYVPFTRAILTPQVYRRHYGKKHVRFDGFMELCSIHPLRFSASPAQIEHLLNLSEGEKYILLRFVSWEASHDIGMSGLTATEKHKLVKELSAYARIIISSESTLPVDLAQYAYRIHPAQMHDLMSRASLLVSESLTMSAEAAFLGTPTLCISKAKAGTLDEEVRLGLIELFRTSDGLTSRAIEIMSDARSKAVFQSVSKEIVRDKIDVTGLMIWVVENYPLSIPILRKNPEFQRAFKPEQNNHQILNNFT